MRAYYLSVINGNRRGIVAAILRLVLRACSWIYCMIVVVRRWAYRVGLFRSYHLTGPVISVGNITWGGVGKTPLVIWLAEEIMARGKKPAILMRGYMPQKNATDSDESDEAQMLRRMFHGQVAVLVHKDRVYGASQLPADDATRIFLLDDGFQHLRVHRDLNIVVIDAMNPFGNAAMIPRGSLREPLSVLRHADICVFSKTDMAPKAVAGIRQRIADVSPHALVVEAAHEPKRFCHLRTGEIHDLVYVQDRPVILLSAIGSPQGFEHTVKNLGADIKEHVIYGDHFYYHEADMRRIVQCAQKNNVTDIVTTAKDGVKLTALLKFLPAEMNIFSLEIAMRILKGEGALHDAIGSVLVD